MSSPIDESRTRNYFLSLIREKTGTSYRSTVLFCDLNLPSFPRRTQILTVVLDLIHITNLGDSWPHFSRILNNPHQSHCLFLLFLVMTVLFVNINLQLSSSPSFLVVNLFRVWYIVKALSESVGSL